MVRGILSAALVVSSAGVAWAQPDTRLADAVQQRRADLAATLLRQRAEPNAQQADGTTALHWAAHWDDRPTAAALLQAGANPNLATRYGVTPLLLAAENGSAPMIDALLAAGADPNAAATGETAILVAARAGSVDAIRALAGR